MGLHINNELRDLISNYTLQRVYPVGAIYMSVNAVNPKDLFGFGTWEQIKGQYFMAYDPYSSMEHKNLNVELGSWFSTTGSTTLTVNQIPSHNHIGKAYFHGYSGFTGGSSGGVYVFNWSSGDCIVNQSSSNTSSLTQLCNQPYTGNSGGGQGHTHPLQSYYPVPTLTLNVWKRVA